MPGIIPIRRVILGGGGDSIAATNFLARTSGLDALHTSEIKKLLNGLTADGFITAGGTSDFFDVLYIFATQDTATAQLNLVSSNFSAVLNGSPNFSADNGYLGVDASTSVFINTQFNATSGTPNYVRDSAHMSVWSLTNGASGATGGVAIGIQDATSQSELFPKYSDGTFNGGINTSLDDGVANSDSTGHYIANRSGASATQNYRNASSIVTGSQASTPLINGNIYVLAENATHTGTTLFGGGYRIAMASIGKSLNQTQVTSFYNRLRTYMTAVGVP